MQQSGLAAKDLLGLGCRACSAELGSGHGNARASRGALHGNVREGWPTGDPELVAGRSSTGGWNTLASRLHATIHRVALGMTGGCRADWRMTGRASVTATPDGTASRIESSALAPRHQANRPPQSARGGSRCASIGVRGRASAGNALGTDCLHTASWTQPIGTTGTDQAHRPIQPCADPIDHPCDIASSATQSKGDQAFCQAGGSRCA